VAGFPAGTESAWRSEEQEELIDFLRALRGTKAKILLTSRREERTWLGDLPTRIAVPQMPMTESFQLARTLAAKHGRRLTDVEDWRPLLAFAQGNPLTLTVVVGEALRQEFKTKDQIGAFVTRLRSGESAFPDETGEGRSRSLGASLAYGFEQAFSEEERKKLALLHLFQGFVDVDALRAMGNPKAPWCLPEVRGLTREEGIVLLDRAAEVGLLTGYGGGYYSIHPALPWFFKGLFEKCYPPEDLAAVHAFVEAMGELGNCYHDQYEGGNRDVLGALRAEEANLLHARRLARKQGWWGPVMMTMQGLRALYSHTGRRAEWKRLVEEILPDFLDSDGGGPLPGREDDWSLVTEYCVRLAKEERRWTEAERLQVPRVDWARRRAAPSLARPVEELEDDERSAIRTLSVSLHELGQIRRELGRVDCVPAYEEALGLSERIGDRGGAAACTFNLGHVFKNLLAIRNLDQAERWYRRSLELHEERDWLGRSGCWKQLGIVAQERFREAELARRPKEELLRYLAEAAELCHKALDLLLPDAVNDMAVLQNQLGTIYSDAGNFDLSVPHFREAIQLFDQIGDLFHAAQARFNVAVTFAQAGRLMDALDYAQAALQKFESFGGREEDDVERTRRLIAEIQGV
jgi:tetratricopeptide (TPR) repeat protein